MYKVYIVDDEAAIVKSLCTAVDWEAYSFEIAGAFTDSQEALAKLATEETDLLITDVCMPVMDGLTLMKKAKVLHPALKIIVVSAHDNFDYVKTALKNGAENYLLKPLNPDELIETLQKTVENIENDSLSALYTNSNILAFKNNIMERWVRNTISQSELMERAGLIGINLASSHFTVIIFQNVAAPLNIEGTSNLMHILEKNLSGLDIHFFINSAFFVVGVLFSMQQVPEATLHAFIDRIEFKTGKEKINLFTIVGPTVCDAGQVNKSFQQAKKYISSQYLGYRHLFCSDFTEGTPLLSTLCDGLIKVSDHMNDIKPSEFENVVKTAVNDAFKGSSAEIQKKIAFSTAINIYDILQKSRQDQKPPEAFMNCFLKFSSLKPLEIEKWIKQLINLAVEILNDNHGLLHPYVRKSIEYIYRESNQDISLKTIAAEFNVSPAYLGQLFRTQTGKYFNDYLTSVRLEYSRKMIVETDMKVSDIALQAGFSSQTYFNRIFKRVYSTSPREYRYSVRAKPLK